MAGHGGVRVLLAHNRYQQAGGEDVVFAAESELLRRAGHPVIEYVRDNDEIPARGFLSRLRLASDTIWAHASVRDLRTLLRRERPDVAHFHNTLPLISPAAYYACREVGVPVVQTLHNYRVICPVALLYRDGHVCEDCLGRLPWPGVVHGCYRGSRAATAAVAAMLAVHRALGTWRDRVDCYVALTEFARGKFAEGGLPPAKIVVKPHFVHPDPGQATSPGEYALFVGRLTEGKGLRTLLAAWKQLRGPVPLRIVGDGPLRKEMEGEASRAALSAVRFFGRLVGKETITAIKQARFFVFPSEWYEGFGLSMIEAFACGVPVIASRLGAMAEIVDDRRTGLHFTAGDPDDLAAKVDWAWSHPREMKEMGRAARAEYEAKYTAERNYPMLMEIYRGAIQQHAAGQTG